VPRKLSQGKDPVPRIFKTLAVQAGSISKPGKEIQNVVVGMENKNMVVPVRQRFKKKQDPRKNIVPIYKNSIEVGVSQDEFPPG
jgi:hypothetical protein